jgi:hypothetical protein
MIHHLDFGELLGVEENKVVYRVSLETRSRGLFAFDLKTNKLSHLVGQQHWDLPGRTSPDRTMSVVSDSAGEIHLHRLGKAPKLIAKEFRAMVEQATLEGVPCLWLDDKRILTIRTNQDMVILNINGDVEDFTKTVEVPRSVLLPPHLWRDRSGQVVYSIFCKGVGDRHFLIDMRKKTASALKNHVMGHDFEASVAHDKKLRRKVYFNGTEIGQWCFHPFQAETAPELVAFPYAEASENANLGNPHGVAVWNRRIGEWRTSKMWVRCTVGWAK